MIISGQRSLPLSVHNQFVITFTSTLFLGSRLRLRHCTRTTPDLHRYPSPGIGHFTLYWSSWFSWILLQLLPWIDIAPLPFLGCFCTVLLCCLITWATHSHPFRAPRVLWVSTGTHRCVDPPRQGAGSTMRQPSGCCTAAALH